MHVPKLNNSHYTSFKAIYFERGKYSEPQQETMKDIVNKLRTKDPSDSSGLTYEAKLKNIDAEKEAINYTITFDTNGEILKVTLTNDRLQETQSFVLISKTGSAFAKAK